MYPVDDSLVPAAVAFVLAVETGCLLAWLVSSLRSRKRKAANRRAAEGVNRLGDYLSPIR